MAPIPFRMGQWRFGPDYRMTTKSARGRGIVSWSPFSSVLESPFSVFASDFDGVLTGIAMLFVTDSPPFSADDQGNAFPAGTRWAAAWGTAEPTTSQLPGATNPETHGIFSVGVTGRKVWLMYRATGIAALASGSITLQKHTSGDTIVTITVNGSDGPNQTVLFDEFDGFGDDTIDVVTDWGSLAHVPHYQAVCTHPANDLEYWAIPVTLPMGYTARIAGNFHYQVHADRSLIGQGIPLAGPYRTLENAEMIVPGIGPNGEAFLWLDGEPWAYGWQTEAIDQRSFLALAQATPDIDVPSPPAPFPFTIPGVITNASGTTHGLRSWSLFIQSQDGFGNPVSTGGAGYTCEVKRTDTGATLTSATYSAADLVAGQTVTGSTVEHATLGDDVTITVTLTRSGSPHNAGIVYAWFRGAFRCNIPLPFSVSGASEVVGGGYLVSSLIAPSFTGGRALVRLGAGVTSYTPTLGEPVAFKIGSDGWYRVTQDATDLSGVGEFEFGYGQSQTADRGRTGRSFYVAPRSTTILALASYSPSFGAIASGGTTFQVSTQGCWAFKTMAFPAAGTYRVRITPTDWDAVYAGLVFEWQTTGSDCLNPTGIDRWRSIDLLVNLIDARWAGTTSTPPGAYSGTGIRDAWIVGANPTGALVGHENDVVLSDKIADGYRFLTPRAGAYMQNTAGDDWTWFDGRQWQDSGAPVIERLITVDAATTIYTTFRWLTNERLPSTPHFKAEWTAV